MIVKLPELRQALVAFLNQRNIPATLAFPPHAPPIVTEPLVLVSLLEAQVQQAGLGAFLGLQWDPVAQDWAEVYASRLSLSFALDLFVHPKQGDQAIQATLDELFEAFFQDAPPGLSSLHLLAGDTQVDNALLRRRLTLSAQALIGASPQDDGSFSDFYVKGGPTIV